jgi:hypothetical protein
MEQCEAIIKGSTSLNHTTKRWEGVCACVWNGGMDDTCRPDVAHKHTHTHTHDSIRY